MTSLDAAFGFVVRQKRAGYSKNPAFSHLAVLGILTHKDHSSRFSSNYPLYLPSAGQTRSNKGIPLCQNQGKRAQRFPSHISSNKFRPRFSIAAINCPEYPDKVPAMFHYPPRLHHGPLSQTDPIVLPRHFHDIILP